MMLRFSKCCQNYEYGSDNLGINFEIVRHILTVIKIMNTSSYGLWILTLQLMLSCSNCTQYHENGLQKIAFEVDVTVV